MGVPELEQQISAQGLKVKELKTSKADADTIKAEVAVLLKLKQEITALDPNHPQAIVDKKKKKEKRKRVDGLRIFTEEELKIGQGGGTADCPFDCDCCF